MFKWMPVFYQHFFSSIHPCAGCSGVRCSSLNSLSTPTALLRGFQGVYRPAQKQHNLSSVSWVSPGVPFQLNMLRKTAEGGRREATSSGSSPCGAASQSLLHKLISHLSQRESPAALQTTNISITCMCYLRRNLRYITFQCSVSLNHLVFVFSSFDPQTNSGNHKHC